MLNPMATPPRVTDRDLYAAMARIARRHRRAGDDDPQAFSDDPRDVLAYLRKLPDGRLLGNDTEHDITDGLTIRVWLWWEGEAFELRLLEAAQRTGFPRRRVAERLKIKTGQGVVDRRDRKRIMLGPIGKPDEKVARAERREERQPAGPPPMGELLWSFVQVLHANRDSLPEDITEDVDYLVTELSDQSATLPAHVAELVRDMRAAGVLEDGFWRGQVDLLLRWFAI